MRVMQAYMPITGMLGKGVDPYECAIWPKIVLVDDGAGLGHAADEDELLDKIGKDYGVLLAAKDVDTMLRGLDNINQDQAIKGRTGLAVVAMRYSAGGGSKLMKGLTLGAKLVRWTGHRGAQGVLHGSFNIAAFLSRVHYYKGAGTQQGDIGPSMGHSGFVQTKKKMNKAFLALGAKKKVTWEEFKSNHIGDALEKKCVMVLVCATNAISNDLGSTSGVIAIRNINTSLTVGQLRAQAAKAFKGKNKAELGYMFNQEGWDDI